MIVFDRRIEESVRHKEKMCKSIETKKELGIICEKQGVNEARL